ncbi:microtubule-associated protein 2-like isoform X3 [Mytilus edulis]|uniref:microtubule-associated protein 2-like isoform X3 n=1 Tax=Mytilus edulis TaxID=6550 RepID=UPI0039EF0810
MDDNLDLDSSDPFISKGHSDNGEINQSDLLNYQMANQQVPGYSDDYHGDETDDSLLHGQNQSSFIPPFTGKELIDSSLSDSNRDWEREDDMMLNQGSHDPLVKGSMNQFQPDLLNMNPLSLESKSSHEGTSFRDDFFAPNNLSEKPIAQTGYEEHVPASQPPDLLMMESSPSHTEVMEGHEQTVSTCDTDLKSCDDQDLHSQSIPHDRHEAIENDFYNEDENADHYDDEYVDSEESDYTDESMDKMEGETGLEHNVPDICDTEEKQQPVQIEDTKNALNNSVDPNIGASGITQKDSDYLRNVQFEDNIVHGQLSDEENGNMADQASQPAATNSEHLDRLKQDEKESLHSDSENEFESGTPQQISSKESNEDKIDLISDQQVLEGTIEMAKDNKDIPIESDDSDMEERSLTPDPNQSSSMETGPPFQDFVGGQSTDQVQISGLVEGTLKEESESTDDEELEQHGLVPLEQCPDSVAMTMEHTQQIDNNFVTQSEHVDQFDLQKGNILEGLSDNEEKHLEESFEQSHCLHEQQEIEKQNSFDNEDIEMESKMHHEQLNETEKIDDVVSDELEISHHQKEDLLTESTLSESNVGLEMATNPSVEPTLSDIPPSEEVQPQTLLSAETFESENQNIGEDLENKEVQETLDKDLEQVDNKPDIEYSDESEDEKDDKIQNEESGMDGSTVMEEGVTLNDKKMEESISSEGEQESIDNGSMTTYMMENSKGLQSEQEISSFEPANYSTNLQMPASQLPEAGEEASIISDEANKVQISDKNEPAQLSPDSSTDEEEIPANQMRETGMEGSFVLDEDETFDDKNFDGDNAEFVQSTPETSPEDEIPANQMREPLILDDKTFGDEKNENEQPISDDSQNNDIQANQMRESGMEGSFVLEDGETFEDNKYAGDVDEFEQSTPEISPEQEQIPQSQMRETGMEGSLVLDKGETFDDKNYDGDEGEFEQSTPEVSPEDEVPVHQMRESGMEGSLVLDEGETFDDKTYEGDQAQYEHNVDDFERTSPEISPESEQILHSQMRETGMEGSLVLDEGETFDDKNYDGDEGEFEQSTPEVSPENEVPVHQMRETGMEGSLVLDEGETFDDKNYDGDEGEFEQSTPEVSPEDEVPVHQMRESGMEGSFVLEEGKTFDDKQFESDMPEFEQSTPEVSPEEEIPANLKRETGMKGSDDEGETFEDNKAANDEAEFEQSTPEDEIQTSHLKTTGMDDSALLDENKQFNDITDEPTMQSHDLSSNQRDDLESFVGGHTIDDGSEAVNHYEESLQAKETVQEEMKPVVSIEREEPETDLHMENHDENEETTESLEPADRKTDEGHFAQDSLGQQIEEMTSPETQTDSYGEEGDVEGHLAQDSLGQQIEEMTSPETQTDSYGEEGDVEGHLAQDSLGQQKEEMTSPETQTDSYGKEGDVEGHLAQDSLGQQIEEMTSPETQTDSYGEEGDVEGHLAQDSLGKEIEEMTSPETQTDSYGEEGDVEGHLAQDSLGQHKEDVTSPETQTDSYGEEGDVESAIQSPLSQNGMLRSPSSDENAQLYVEHENEKNLMSSSLTEGFVDQDEAIQTYQPCMQNGISQNGVSHSASEEVTPEKEENEHPCFQNGISQSTSDEFTPEREKKTDFNLIKKEGKPEIVTKVETKSEVKDSIAKSEVKKKTGIMKSEVKKLEQSSPKKTLKLAKPESQKKDFTKENKKIIKDTTRKKDPLSKLPSPTKTDKRSMSACRLTNQPTRTDKSATRMPRDTTRKPRPTTTDPVQQTKQRPKSIDISRTSSLTRPTKSSLCKSRTFEKSALEGATSPTKPLRSVPKTAPSRYRITRSKKDASSDSGVEEDKSPRKTETQNKSQDDKMTRSTSAKRSTIPTMNRSLPTKSEGSPRKTAGKPTPTKTTQSKIGSLDNTKYSPGGGQVKIQSHKQDFSKVSSKIGSKDHLTHKPAGGDKKIVSQKLEWKAESKVGSLKNATYSPRGGNVKIQTEKLTWNGQSKVGSLDNASHSPGGGHVKIKTEKLKWKAEPQVNSLENTGYVPGGGHFQIEHHPINWNTHSKVDSLENAHYSPGGGNVKIHEEKLSWNVHSKVNSLENAQYTARGGTHRFPFPIENKKLDFKDKAQSKVGSKDHMNHKAGGGDKKIESQKLSFKEKAQSKVGSKDNMDHKPLGGDKKIDTQKLTFKETAKPRTDTGVAPGKSRPDSGIECEKTEASV